MNIDNIVNQIKEFVNNLPPIFYDSSIKKEDSKSINDIRQVVRNEVKDYNLEKTEKEIKMLKKQLLNVHR